MTEEILKLIDIILNILLVLIVTCIPHIWQKTKFKYESKKEHIKSIIIWQDEIFISIVKGEKTVQDNNVGNITSRIYQILSKQNEKLLEIRKNIIKESNLLMTANRFKLIKIDNGEIDDDILDYSINAYKEVVNIIEPLFNQYIELIN